MAPEAPLLDNMLVTRTQARVASSSLNQEFNFDSKRATLISLLEAFVSLEDSQVEEDPAFSHLIRYFLILVASIHTPIDLRVNKYKTPRETNPLTYPLFCFYPGAAKSETKGEVGVLPPERSLCDANRGGDTFGISGVASTEAEPQRAMDASPPSGACATRTGGEKTRSDLCYSLDPLPDWRASAKSLLNLITTAKIRPLEHSEWKEQPALDLFPSFKSSDLALGSVKRLLYAFLGFYRLGVDSKLSHTVWLVLPQAKLCFPFAFRGGGEGNHWYEYSPESTTDYVASRSFKGKHYKFLKAPRDAILTYDLYGASRDYHPATEFLARLSKALHKDLFTGKALKVYSADKEGISVLVDRGRVASEVISNSYHTRLGKWSIGSFQSSLSARLFGDIATLLPKRLFLVFNTLTFAEEHIRYFQTSNADVNRSRVTAALDAYFCKVFKYVYGPQYVYDQDQGSVVPIEIDTSYLRAVYAIRPFPRVCTMEFGKVTGRLHFHTVEGFVKCYPSLILQRVGGRLSGTKPISELSDEDRDLVRYRRPSFTDPNYGIKIPNKKELNELKHLWRYGTSAPKPVRYAPEDSWVLEYGFRYPTVKTGKAPLPNPPLSKAVGYLTKYVSKTATESEAKKRCIEMIGSAYGVFYDGRSLGTLSWKSLVESVPIEVCIRTLVCSDLLKDVARELKRDSIQTPQTYIQRLALARVKAWLQQEYGLTHREVIDHIGYLKAHPSPTALVGLMRRLHNEYGTDQVNEWYNELFEDDAVISDSNPIASFSPHARTAAQCDAVMSNAGDDIQLVVQSVLSLFSPLKALDKRQALYPYFPRVVL